MGHREPRVGEANSNARLSPVHRPLTTVVEVLQENGTQGVSQAPDDIKISCHNWDPRL